MDLDQVSMNFAKNFLFIKYWHWLLKLTLTHLDINTLLHKGHLSIYEIYSMKENLSIYEGHSMNKGFYSSIYVFINEGHSMNKGNLGEKSKIDFLIIFFHEYKLCIVGNCFIGKIICFQAIQNDSKSNRMLQFWTKVCHQTLVSWEVQTMWNLQCDIYKESCFGEKMFTNGLKMGLSLLVWIEKTVHEVEIHWLSSKEKVPGTAVSKEGDADSVLGQERRHYYWFPWKRSNSKQCLL